VTSVADTFFARMLRAVARMVGLHPRWFVLPQILLFGLCVFYSVFRLSFDMSRDNLVGSDKKYHQVFMKFHKEFPGEDEFAVVVESQSMDLNRQFVERISFPTFILKATWRRWAGRRCCSRRKRT
jgi:predicted RND superfamily exporter protein